MPPILKHFPMTIQRTEHFVPLTTESVVGGSRDFRITVIPQAERGGFKGLEDDTARLRPMSAAVSLAGANGGMGTGGGAVHQQSGNGKYFPGKRSCEPQVLLQREGERITSIRIQCSCGQVLDLACDYGDTSPVKTA